MQYPSGNRELDMFGENRPGLRSINVFEGMDCNGDTELLFTEGLVLAMQSTTPISQTVQMKMEITTIYALNNTTV